MDISQEEKQSIREKIEKLKQSKFKQQNLPAWRPVPTVSTAIFTFSSFGVVFLSLGVLLSVLSNQIVEIEQRYDELCYKDLRS